MELRRDKMKMNIDYFEIQKLIQDTECSNLAEKLDKKLVHLPSNHVSLLIYGS